MNLFSFTATTDLPSFNKIALVVINFIVFGLILAVFSQTRFKDKRSKIFALMGALILVWVDSAYLARLVGQNNRNLSELFLRLAWVATPPLFYSTYLISVHVIKQQRKFIRLSWVLFAFTILVSGATAFTNLIISGIEFVGINLDIVYGLGFYPFLLIIFIFMVATLAPLLRTKLTKRARIFLIGVITFYVANLVFNIALPVFFNITHLYYLGDYSTLFLLGFTTYAILRHELFDTKILATKALTVIIWIVLFSKLFVSRSAGEIFVDSMILAAMVVFGVLLIRSVIREVKQREQLEEVTKKLKDLDKLKDEFISMAAHELRTPITAIKGYLSMIIEGDTGDVSKKALGYLIDASAVNDRLIRLVNNMLNVSRIEERRMVYQVELVDLGKSVGEVFYSFKLEADRKGIDYTMNFPTGVKDKVFVDPDRIREVTGNLVSNAIKFTEKGSVAINISQPKRDIVRVEVVDTGPGITKEEQKKLFNKFYRIESTAGRTMGTGLGLYISSLLVGKFSGKIGIDSEFGKGSTFWFELPIAAMKSKNS
ncbi:hypothetical protein IID22_00370 [Patescibacteria group bacterium]|nr:hypothetical protein [Patescibacteria group bacterium]